LHEVIGKIHANQYLEKQEETYLSHQ
jgi:hypothetical protein